MATLRSARIMDRRKFRRSGRHVVRPAVVEMLEGRAMLSAGHVIHVSTASDAIDHAGLSLRDAVAIANADAASGHTEEITFDGALGHVTIALEQGPLEFTPGSAGVTVNGETRITVSGRNASRVFQVDAGATVKLEGLTIIDGAASDGAGILNSGNLHMQRTTLSYNSATGNGGGILNDNGVLFVEMCLLEQNHAGNGGGIYSTGPALTVTHSRLIENSADVNGGGIYLYGGDMRLEEDSLLNNTASVPSDPSVISQNLYFGPWVQIVLIHHTHLVSDGIA